MNYTVEKKKKAFEGLWESYEIARTPVIQLVVWFVRMEKSLVGAYLRRSSTAGSHVYAEIMAQNADVQWKLAPAGLHLWH